VDPAVRGIARGVARRLMRRVAASRLISMVRKTRIFLFLFSIYISTYLDLTVAKMAKDTLIEGYKTNSSLSSLSSSDADVPGPSSNALPVR
jgi:hypothetical protein